MTTIQLHTRDGERKGSEIAISELSAAMEAAESGWVDIRHPDEDVRTWLMDEMHFHHLAVDDWIDQTLAAKGYIQAQEDREDFIVATGAGATKFNKWMKKAGLHFNKQSGRWTRWSDR